jgi:hypothetical protein
VTNQGKALAWRTAEDTIDLISLKASTLSNFFAGKLSDRSGDHSGFGEVELVNGTMPSHQSLLARSRGSAPLPLQKDQFRLVALRLSFSTFA